MNLQDQAIEFAKEFRGNWKKLQSFGWSGKPEDADNCGIHYLESRDSGHLDQSNADCIREALKEWTGAIDDGDDVETQCHSHWGPGWLNGVVVRVYKDADCKEFTPAFLKLVELNAAIAEYPCLDEEDLSRREYEATIENIESRMNRYLNAFAEHDPGRIFSWLWDNEQGELDEQYPSDEAIKRAIAATFDKGSLDKDAYPELFEDEDSE